MDPTSAHQFLTAVRAGASNELAAQHAQVPLDEVRQRMKDDDGFRQDVEKARSDLALLAIGTVRRGLTDKDGLPNTNVAQWLADKVYGDSELERLRDLTT